MTVRHKRTFDFDSDDRPLHGSNLVHAMRELISRDPDALVKAFEVLPHARRQLVAARPELRGKSDDEIALAVTGKPTTRSLRELEGRMADAERRSGEALRRLNRLDGAPLVDAAIADGRLAHDERETVLRRFEADPREAKAHLRTLRPDAMQASRNYFATPVNEAAYRELAEQRGLPVVVTKPDTAEDALARRLGIRVEDLV